MGKYFNNKIENHEQQINALNKKENKKNISIPQNNSIIQDNYKKNIIDTTNNEEETIDEVKKFQKIVEETNIVNNKLNEIKNDLTTETMKSLNEELKNFTPAQIFERLNMIIFLLSRLENRIVNIETKLNIDKNQKNENLKDEKITPTNELKNVEENNEIDWKNVNDVKKYISEKMNSPKIPEENYIDKTIDVEKVFKDKPKEAIEAVYEGMLETNSNIQEEVEKGKMKGIVF
jgi:hypothetical protein